MDSLALNGIEPFLLRVHARLEPGSGVLAFSGLSESHARETRARVLAALWALGCKPSGRFAVRFVPERPELRGIEPSAGNDAAVLLAVLGAATSLDLTRLRGTAVLGQVTLRGELRGVRGALPMVRGAAALGLSRAIFPRANATEVATYPTFESVVANDALELLAHVKEGQTLERAAAVAPRTEDACDLSDIFGFPAARRALEIAAAGHHGLLFLGSPGNGQLVLARRLPGILPEPSHEEALDLTSIHSVAGLLGSGGGLFHKRPFRAPHYTVSPAGLLGGGVPARPGEVTLAHHGVLVLDQLEEFRAGTLESLSTVLRDGQVTLSRRGIRTRFPAQPLLVGTTDPCGCDAHGKGSEGCSCSRERLALRRACLAGPFADRLEVGVHVHASDSASGTGESLRETSAAVRTRVTAARVIQAARGTKLGVSPLNGMLTHSQVALIATPDARGVQVLSEAAARLALSEDARTRILRVARTIADLAGSESVLAEHVAEALAFAAAALPGRSSSKNETATAAA